jgi:hypothetical protein
LENVPNLPIRSKTAAANSPPRPGSRSSYHGDAATISSTASGSTRISRLTGRRLRPRPAPGRCRGPLRPTCRRRLARSAPRSPAPTVPPVRGTSPDPARPGSRQLFGHSGAILVRQRKRITERASELMWTGYIDTPSGLRDAWAMQACRHEGSMPPRPGTRVGSVEPSALKAPLCAVSADIAFTTARGPSDDLAHADDLFPSCSREKGGLGVRKGFVEQEGRPYQRCVTPARSVFLLRALGRIRTCAQGSGGDMARTSAAPMRRGALNQDKRVARRPSSGSRQPRSAPELRWPRPKG